MQIGDLAAKAGVTPRTIRYYEELGIVEPEERTAGGFRLYSEAQLRRLQIVQSLKDLGFELEHIRVFFNLEALQRVGWRLGARARRAPHRARAADRRAHPPVFAYEGAEPAGH